LNYLKNDNRTSANRQFGKMAGLVLISTAVLRLSISANSPLPRKAAGRWVLFFVLTKIRSWDELSFPLGRNKTKNRHTTKKIEKKARYCAPY